MSMLRNKFSLSRYVPRRTCFFLYLRIKFTMSFSKFGSPFPIFKIWSKIRIQLSKKKNFVSFHKNWRKFLFPVKGFRVDFCEDFFAVSRSTEILLESNFWLVMYIHKLSRSFVYLWTISKLTIAYLKQNTI